MSESIDKSKRDFIVKTACCASTVGIACCAIPLVSSMNPAADVRSLATVEVKIGGIEIGESKTIKWRGKPIFIKHRTKEEISEAEKVDISSLRDPQTDGQRVKPGKESWLIMIGICTHLGCIPTMSGGDYSGGWLCPCHGSHYDSSGRIRKGPAPSNLEIPSYQFLDDETVLIG